MDVDGAEQPKKKRDGKKGKKSKRRTADDDNNNNNNEENEDEIVNQVKNKKIEELFCWIFNFYFDKQIFVSKYKMQKVIPCLQKNNNLFYI